MHSNSCGDARGDVRSDVRITAYITASPLSNPRSFATKPFDRCKSAKCRRMTRLEQFLLRFKNITLLILKHRRAHHGAPRCEM